MTLRQARLARGWTQEQLAAASGVDQATISALELGRIKNPSFETVSRIAKALGVEPAVLFPLSIEASR